MTDGGAADLSPVLDLAARVGADTQIRDRSGHVVASSPGLGGRVASQPAGAPIVVRGERAGEAAVRFTGATPGRGSPPTNCPASSTGFWRGRQATQTSGSGIGLAVAAELTLAHGGRLSAASPPGQGTRMTLTVPTSDARGHGGGDDAASGSVRESHRTGSVL
jgi:hypothetical protein